MERRTVSPRLHWQDKVSAVGFPIHTAEGPYWDESVYYTFSSIEVEALYGATNELHEMALKAVEEVIGKRRYGELSIPDLAIPLIEESWNACGGLGAPSIYGRMDLAWDGEGHPKLLEYNADTPTALIEAAIVQWNWKEEVFPRQDQFNGLHEALITGWKDLRPYLPATPLHFASMDVAEDVLTATYLQDTAAQAGIATRFITVPDIGWTGQTFVDRDQKPIAACFKLYPWEWMVREDFAEHLGRAGTRWLEPAWKMLLSNKGILAVLWDLYPMHPNLLPAFIGARRGMESYAHKPLLAREGANVTLVKNGNVIAKGKDDGYGAEGFVYQSLVPPTEKFGGAVPVIGSWLIQGEAKGIGLRESDGPITTNTSRFVPHVLE